MPYSKQEIIVHSFEDGKSAIAIREVLWGISITGKLEVIMREVAHIVKVDTHQNEETYSVPRQGGVPRRERTKQLSGPEGTICTEAEATAEDGLLQPQGVRLLPGRHLQVRGEVHEHPPGRQGLSSGEA